MWLWPQSWQAATWPPRAAVRQRSMADMTLSWARLTWPALAVRQAGLCEKTQNDPNRKQTKTTK